MSAQSLINQGYYGYQGWSDAAADADFNATKGSGKGGPTNSGGGGGNLDPQQAIQASIKALQEANKPAIESYQASIPETQAKYAQSKSQLQASQAPLEQRYTQLLDSIKGNQTTAENRQTLTTNNELGRRGITGSSGVAQQEITNAVNPITQQYTGLSQQTGLAREESIKGLQDQIANLVPQETSDVRAINNAIASLSAGAGQAGLSGGLNLYSTQLQNQYQQQQLAQQQKQNDIANQLAQAQQAQSNKTPLQSASIGQNSTALYDPYSGKVVNTIKGLQSAAGGGW